MKAMELTTENGSMLRKPTEAQLRATLDTLNDDDNGHAILVRRVSHYLQVNGSPSRGYLAEYREGRERTHHVSTSASLTHAQVETLMLTYLADGDWKALTPWTRGMETGASAARRKRVVFPMRVVVPFLAVGLGTTALTVYSAYDSWRFRQGAVVVPGVVTELVGRKTMTAIVEYTDLTGESHQVRSSWASNPPAFHVGERVAVLHQRENPRSARIESFGEMWGGSLFASVFAVVFGSIGLGLLVAGRRT